MDFVKGHIPWNKGKKLTEEHRNKICIARKGAIPIWVKDGWMPTNTGRTRFKKGYHPKTEWQKGNPMPSGEGNPNWQGGKSFEPYPLGWNRTYKEQIRFRDGYKCQVCGCSETENMRKLCIHHIDYNKSNIEHKNLISLCIKCHTRTNSKRDYWKQYFMSRCSLLPVVE
jgi:hypothetical protein